MSAEASSDIPIVPFGRYYGKTASQLLEDTSYYKWCVINDVFERYKNTPFYKYVKEFSDSKTTTSSNVVTTVSQEQTDVKPKLDETSDKTVMYRRKVKFGNLEFKSQKDAKEYVRQLFESIGTCYSLKNKNNSHFNKVLDVLKRHPRASEKLDNLKDIEVKKCKLGFALFVIYNDGTSDDISWNMCITGREKSDSSKLKSALRYAIEDQIQDYKDENDTSYCNECFTPIYDDLHIDHVIHFAKLVYDFNKTRSDIPTVFDDARDLPGHKIFKSSDSKYENEWKTYHRNNAILRPLCRQCNLSRENYSQL